MNLQTRIVCDAASPLENDFIAQIPPVFFERGEIIYNRRNQIRVLDRNGEKINVKKYGIPSVFNRILYSLGIRTPKAERAFENAKKLADKGISTPAPYAYIIEKKRGILSFSYFVSQHIEGTPIGYQSHSKELIAQMARFTAKMHEKGAIHRDYTPNNVLVSQKDGKYIFSLVDTNQCVFSKKPIPVSQALPYLIQLFLKKKELFYFVAEYARCRGANPKICRNTAVQLRKIRSGYSELKKVLKQIPGAHLLTPKRLDKSPDTH